MARQADVVMVVGGRSSNNTRELVKTCARYCARVQHAQTDADVRPEWFDAAKVVGLTPGTSTPDDVIDRVEARIRQVEAQIEAMPRSVASVAEGGPAGAADDVQLAAVLAGLAADGVTGTSSGCLLTHEEVSIPAALTLHPRPRPSISSKTARLRVRENGLRRRAEKERCHKCRTQPPARQHNTHSSRAFTVSDTK
jgi:hypothetical protein